MALYITSLNSGSNGNCYYIANDTEAVLIDVGISCKETEKRMLGLGLNMKKIKAVFISHEHSDHIKGLPVIAKKYSIPVFITTNTYAKSGLQLSPASIRWLNANEEIMVGDLCITAFSKQHDAEDPHSFIVSFKNITVGVFTDIGIASPAVINHFNRCHAAFLETNYDEEMLEKGHYPIYLKNRIRGGMGHLSNRQALEIFTSHRPPFMSHLFLSHLSKDNNNPHLVQQLFENNAGETKIIVASRYEATAVYSIHEMALNNLLFKKAKAVQMDLFD